MIDNNIISLTDTELAIISMALDYLICDDLEEIEIDPDAEAYNRDRIARARELNKKVGHPDDLVIKIVERACTAVRQASDRNVKATLEYVCGLSDAVRTLVGRTLNTWGIYRDACASNKILLGDYFTL